MSEVEVSKEYLADFRGYLRITSEDMDGEIEDTIKAARNDLILAGVLKERVEDESDALVKRAIATYVKAEFGLDNPDSEKYRAAYESMKTSLALATHYIKTEEG